MEPKFEHRASFTLVGLYYRGKNENDEIPQLWPALMQRVGEIKNIANRHWCYGVEDDFDEKAGVFSYLAGFEVSSIEEMPEGMASWQVPEQNYAVFPCTMPTLRQTYQHIYRTWLPNSECSRAKGPEFEFYDENFDGSDPERAL